MNTLSDINIVFYLVILYAVDMRSIMTFSIISKLSRYTINKCCALTTFTSDYKNNHKYLSIFHDMLSIPMYVCYELFEQFKIEQKSLDMLDYYDCNQKDIDNFIITHHFNYNELWPIKKLCIGDVQDDLYDKIEEMHELKILDIRCAAPLSNKFGYYDKLVKLKLFSPDIDHLPESICDLHNLESLSIIDIRFEVIPNCINKLTKLKKLKLIIGPIVKIPLAMCNMTCLEMLVLRGNRINTIPNKIYKLQNLEIIDMCDNDLKSLPSSIIKMSRLKTILLNGNYFRSFPTVLQQIIPTPDLHIKMFSNYFETIQTREITKQQFIERLFSTRKNDTHTWVTIVLRGS